VHPPRMLAYAMLMRVIGDGSEIKKECSGAVAAVSACLAFW